jgi:hypothetical protein
MDKYPLSESNRNIFLVELNKAIEDAAEDDSKNILQQNFDSLAVYPPNGSFTDEEKVALRSIASVPNAESALRKVLANASASVIFNMLNLIDGTSDPESEDWTGVTLVDADTVGDPPYAMLHDDFYEKYWDWRKARGDKGWRLDMYDDDAK